MYQGCTFKSTTSIIIKIIEKKKNKKINNERTYFSFSGDRQEFWMMQLPVVELCHGVKV